MVTLDVEVADIRKIVGDSNLKAFADLKIGGSLIIKGFSVMQGKRGVFVSMPRKVNKDGKWFDMITPTNDDFRQELEEKVLEAYEQEIDGGKN